MLIGDAVTFSTEQLELFANVCRTANETFVEFARRIGEMAKSHPEWFDPIVDDDDELEADAAIDVNAT